MGEWTVLGRSFRTKRDYELAKRDAGYITQIKKRYRLEEKEEKARLLQDLRAQKYIFLTILGQDFEEEIQEMLEKHEETSTGRGKKKIGGTPGNRRKETGKTGKESSPSQPMRLEDYDKEMQKIIKMELKKRERNRRLIIFSSVSVALFCFAYLAFDSFHASKAEKKIQGLSGLKGTESKESTWTPSITKQEEETITEIPEILKEYESLYNYNKDLIGWLKIADTNIDYPVLRTEDNEYYLRRDFERKYDKNGSIFMDKDGDVLNRSTNLIIYGHHMSSGNMFGKLDKYSSKDYYENHKYIQFDTIYEKGTYEVMYVFRSRIYEEDEIIFKYYQFIDVNSEVEFDSHMAEMAEMSLYDTGVTAKYGDELITLSTCDYYTSYGRFVVVARRIS